MSAATKSPGVRAVLDASVVARALIDRQPSARAWLERVDRRNVDAVVPELVFAETGQALALHVRAGLIPLAGAIARLEFVCGLPLDVRPLDLVAPRALAVAIERELSVYDACYAVLADVENALLVTADRRLADVVTHSELLL